MFGFILGSLPIIFSLLISILYFSTLKTSRLALFPYYLTFKLFSEYSSFFYTYYKHRSNHVFYNLVFFIDVLFYFLIFVRFVQRKIFHVIVLCLGSIFFLFYFYNILFKQGLFFFNTYTFSAGAIILLLMCLLYLLQMFLSETEINYFRIPMFWIATGLMFYYAGNLLYISLLSHIIEKNIDPRGNIFLVIMILSNTILYGFFSIGFLSGNKWKTKKC
ncbi:hypothetical protein BH09BAC2_BH09BAC2_07980 [soil metagenome]